MRGAAFVSLFLLLSQRTTLSAGALESNQQFSQLELLFLCSLRVEGAQGYSHIPTPLQELAPNSRREYCVLELH